MPRTPVSLRARPSRHPAPDGNNSSANRFLVLRGQFAVVADAVIRYAVFLARATRPEDPLVTDMAGQYFKWGTGRHQAVPPGNQPQRLHQARQQRQHVVRLARQCHQARIRQLPGRGPVLSYVDAKTTAWPWARLPRPSTPGSRPSHGGRIPVSCSKRSSTIVRSARRVWPMFYTTWPSRRSAGGLSFLSPICWTMPTTSNAACPTEILRGRLPPKPSELTAEIPVNTRDFRSLVRQCPGLTAGG